MSSPAGPARPRRHLLPGMAALAVLICGLWAAGKYYRASPLEQLPAIDASRAHPSVQRAIDEARAAVAAAPRSGLAWGRLGAVLRAHDFDVEANQCLAHAGHLDPQEVRWPYLLGISLAVSDPQGAEEQFRRAAELRPELALPRLRLGELLLDQRRLDEASRQFQSVLATGTDNPRAHLGLARAACLQGDFKAGLQAAQASAAGAPGQRATHELLLQIHHRLGDDRAAAAERRLLDSLPTAETTWDDTFVDWVMRFRRDPAWLASSAQELLAAGRDRDAVALLEELVAAEPGDPQWPVRLGRTLVQLREYTRAAAVLDAALEKHSDSAELRFQRGIVHFVEQQWPAAVVAFREAVRLKPDYSLAHYNLGHALKRLGDRDGAIAAFRDAVRFQPDFAAAHANLGGLLLETGARAAAHEHLRTAVALDPNDPVPRRLLETP